MKPIWEGSTSFNSRGTARKHSWDSWIAGGRSLSQVSRRHSWSIMTKILLDRATTLALWELWEKPLASSQIRISKFRAYLQSQAIKHLETVVSKESLCVRDTKKSGLGLMSEIKTYHLLEAGWILKRMLSLRMDITDKRIWKFIILYSKTQIYSEIPK